MPIQLQIITAAISIGLVLFLVVHGLIRLIDIYSRGEN